MGEGSPVLEAGHRFAFVVAVVSKPTYLTIDGREYVKEAGLNSYSLDVELKWVINSFAVRAAKSARVEPVSPTGFAFVI